MAMFVATIASLTFLSVVATPTNKVHGKGGQLETHTKNLTAVPATLRGGQADHHRKPVTISALQAKQSTRLRSSKGSLEQTEERREERRAAHKVRHERSYFTQLLKNLHQQAAKKAKHAHKKVDLCNGEEFEWMVSTRQACKDNFGDESVWDNQLGDGGCREAWDECNSDFQATCCTQPEGPQNMDAYCARPETQEDRACAVQRQMGEQQSLMGGIRDGVSVLDTAPPVPA